jgi:uncharacterized membrane protein YphA (DoxX/SURF4 family)
MLKLFPDSERQPMDISAVPDGVLARSSSVIMTAGRVLARVLSGAVYISAGYQAARAPGGRVGRAGDTLNKIRRVIPLPVDDELIVRANGAAQLTAGTTLALGLKPRFSAAVLAVSLLPTTIAGHAFWTSDDPLERRSQQQQFLKNMAMFGGLLFAMIDSPSRDPKGKIAC